MGLKKKVIGPKEEGDWAERERWLGLRRKIIWPKEEEESGEWRKPHNEELYHLYSSPNVNRVVTSWWMRGAGHVARMGRKGCLLGTKHLLEAKAFLKS